MTFSLSPLFNGWQGFGTTGLPLNAGQLYTYSAGTTTPLATYTTSAGNVPNSNPIVLGSDGRPPQEIWLNDSSSYKFVLADSSNNTIATYDNIQSIGSIVNTAVSAAGGITQAQADGRYPLYVGQAGGSSDALTATLATSITALYNGLLVEVDASFANTTTTPTFNLTLGATVTGAFTIVKLNLQPVSIGDIAGSGNRIFLGWASGTSNWVLMNPSNVITQSVGDSSNKPASTAFVLQNNPSLRGYLAGCTLSTAGASATMSISAGYASDSTFAITLQLAATSKTTASWAVGSGSGGLDTGSIANSTWYYFYVIRRPDTGVVDAIFSLSSSAPTLPANYTQYRYIGAGLTNGSAQWTAFTQVGDEFYWSTPTLDFSGAGSATAALVTLTVPRGRKVKAIVVYSASAVAASTQDGYLSDPANADLTPSFTAAPLGHVHATTGGGQDSLVQVWTNTSAQIRHRETNTGGNVYISTHGWIDRRDRDA